MLLLTVNDRSYQTEAAPDTPLLWVLRDNLHLTGTKYACGRGLCGACTVLIDGRPQRACVTPVQAVAGRRITTIEGIPAEHPVKQAWLRAQVPQCGYCQPGMIMQTIGLRQQHPEATLADLLQGLRGNLCRCGTYPRIKQALADLLAGADTAPVAAAPAFFSPEPRLGPGFGLLVVPGKPDVSLAAVARRRSVLDPPVWLWLTADNLLTLIISKAEMGQGVYTALPLLAAAELDHPWDLVRLEAAPAAPGYADPQMRRQVTGGSTSIAHLHGVFRRLGAAAREMLAAAAARIWGVPVSDCSVSRGKISHAPSGRQVDCGEVCQLAATEPVPQAPSLRLPADQNFLSQGQSRTDLSLKVNGAPIFGLDQVTTSRLYGVVARPPRYGAEIVALDTGAAAAQPGVRQIVRWDQNLGVIAETLAQAWQARDLLNITWSPGSRPDIDDASLAALFQQQLAQPGVLVQEQGNPEAALASAALVHNAEYILPYLAHATLEPMNCLADVRPDGVELWAPLQNQTAALEMVQELTGLPPDQIVIHTTFLGGGFGRRLEVDYVAEAVRLSQAAGQPVQLVWTREEDFRYDFFRPMTASRLRGGLDARGRLTVWDHTIAAPSILARLYPAALKKGYDPNTVDGVQPFAYTCPHFRLTAVQIDTPIPVGFWRSVGHSHNAFTVECFLDELAHLAGQDPLAFRLAHLPPDSRAARLLTLVADKAGWGSPLPSGWGRGLAQHFSFGSYVAQVAEVAVDQDAGRIQVQRVVGAIDCGRVVNPDTVVAQMEGGILFGLSAALHEEVHFAQGGVATENFHDYRLLTLPEAPAIEVYLAPSGEPPGGVGEPGVPPIAPAVANAVFAATGRRLRRLPLAPG